MQILIHLVRRVFQWIVFWFLIALFVFEWHAIPIWWKTLPPIWWWK
jgi:hypothetical protein